MSNELIWMARKSLAPRPAPAVYGELERYAGELLDITSIRVTVFQSHVIATVRYDADTDFEISVYKLAQQLLTDAGYTIPTERGEHPFTATVVCKWAKLQYTREWDLQITHVIPQAVDVPETPLTPLQKQNAIETICHYDKRVTNVHSSFDVMLNPVIRIECSTANKAAIESAIAAYNDGSVAITWKLITAKQFTGSFDKTDKIPLKKVG